MPVGPVYEGGIGESVHFMLETVGEDVLRAVPRLFFNFRGVEKIAEGKSVAQTLLLVRAICRQVFVCAFAGFLQRSRENLRRRCSSAGKAIARRSSANWNVCGITREQLRGYVSPRLLRCPPRKPPSSRNDCCEPPADLPGTGTCSG